MMIFFSVRFGWAFFLLDWIEISTYNTAASALFISSMSCMNLIYMCTFSQFGCFFARFKMECHWVARSDDCFWHIHGGKEYWIDELHLKWGLYLKWNSYQNRWTYTRYRCNVLYIIIQIHIDSSMLDRIIPIPIDCHAFGKHTIDLQCANDWNQCFFVYVCVASLDHTQVYWICTSFSSC